MKITIRLTAKTLEAVGGRQAFLKNNLKDLPKGVGLQLEGGAKQDQFFFGGLPSKEVADWFADILAKKAPAALVLPERAKVKEQLAQRLQDRKAAAKKANDEYGEKFRAERQKRREARHGEPESTEA